MKVAEIENNILVVKEREDEKLDGRKGALVKVLGCGLCGSDIVKLTQHLAKEGTVLGHEIVASIVEIDSDTDLKLGIQLSHLTIFLVENVSIARMEMFQCVVISRKQISAQGDLVNLFLYQKNI